MDEFNFRLYSKKSKEYVHLKSIFYDNNNKIDSIVIVDPTIATYDMGINYKKSGKDYIFERCSGIRDKNGKLIYENDIIKWNNVLYGNNVVTWEFDAYTSMVGLTPVDANIEIIGNIHQNKELLKG